MRPAISTVGNRIKGFAYIFLLVALLVMAIGAETAYVANSRLSAADREAELLFRGQAYRNAIRSYYLAKQPHTFPRRLEDLLQDPRFLHKKHLRRLYPEPMEGEWRLILDKNKGIMGVASRSKDAPFKQVDFPEGLERFEGAEHYSDWVFTYGPSTLVPNRLTTSTAPSRRR